MKILEYKILKGFDPPNADHSNLVFVVNRYIKEGWVPTGGLQIKQNGKHFPDEHFQAMVLYESKT